VRIPKTARRVSVVLHWIGDLTARPGTALVAGVVVVVFGIVLAIDGFPPNWETAFSAVASAVTLVMLFIIQHTQSRHQLSLQLKLDELIRTSPHADDQLVRIEVADDDELDELKRSQQALHESIRDTDTLEIIEFNRDARD
jgi:low affinity Fe/Cu permease